MSNETIKTNTLQFNCLTVEAEREMTNAELAEYFRGIAEMFDRQEQEGNKYGFNGFNGCIVKFFIEYK